MAKNLVIVESPAKAKTIEKYLGKDFKVLSSYGHVRDLPKKGMSIDIKNNFEPTYEVTPDKKKTIAALRKAVKTAETVWLATDEDREGEAISWHLAEALKLKPANTKRIGFHEITKSAVTKAIENPREINQELVDAQQARRVLDRVVGYELSPLLWRKVQPGLSAGRVQSVAVRLIVEREREIENFKAEASYKVSGTFESAKQIFDAKLEKDLEDEDASQKFLKDCSHSDFAISSVEKKPGVKRPGPPFTTSTLQQFASRALGYSPRQTMRLAQRLYEAGHITYMRTDSLNLSQQALLQAKEVIEKSFGSNYHNQRVFKTKSKGAQEAHEAIRPTSFALEKAGDDAQQEKLYRLIRSRALASQMADAKVDKTTVKIQPSKAEPVFIAKGEIITFDGFTCVQGKIDDVILPELREGDSAKAKQIEARQTLSRGPARYTEASLIKALEEHGIGRPSTYAPTISTIQDRNYVEKSDIEGVEQDMTVLILKDSKIETTTEKKAIGQDRGKLLPTSVGIIVSDFLVKHFDKVVDYEFTADLEKKFDHVADGEIKWQQVLKDFYAPFHKRIDAAQNITKKEASQAKPLGKHPKTGKPIYARLGRYGPMVQMGEAEDEEKPQFATMPEGYTIENVTIDAALKAFELPRVVGKTEDGQEITANIGRFGPYVKVGSTFVSIKDEDPHKVSEETARKLIAEKLEQQKKALIQDFGDGLQVKTGRFGPYVTNGKVNAKIPKDKDPKKLTETEVKELIANKKPARRKTNKK